MVARVHAALLDALAVVFPVECAGCGRADRVLCAECRAALRPSTAGPSALRPIAHSPSALSPTVHFQTIADQTPVFSALRYEGVVRSVVLDFKERGRTDLARPLSQATRVAIDAAVAGLTAPVEVCPIPSSRSALRRRGFGPVEVLVRGCGLRAARVLALSTEAMQQKTLGRVGREVNIRGSLRARAPLHGRRFIIVDDIITTGSTVSEAVRALRAAGGEVLAAATLAFTPRRVSTSDRIFGR